MKNKNNFYVNGAFNSDGCNFNLSRTQPSDSISVWRMIGCLNKIFSFKKSKSKMCIIGKRWGKSVVEMISKSNKKESNGFLKGLIKKLFIEYIRKTE